MSTRLNSDILYTIAQRVAAASLAAPKDSLLSLSLTCRVLRAACLPWLFKDVHWPHRNKHHGDAELLFFPSNLWSYIGRFHLAWPDEWPDAVPPRFGNKHLGHYHPRDIEKLVDAIPGMTTLSTFVINCPFIPPSALIKALIQSPSVRHLSISETPLNVNMIVDLSKLPSHLESLALVAVGQAVRVGEGVFDSKYAEVAYYIREWRKRFKHDIAARFATMYILDHLSNLSHLEISGDLCTLDNLDNETWPNLSTLVFTGHAPLITDAEFLDVLARMPKLKELRLLFTRTKDGMGFPILPQTADGHTSRGNSPFLLASIKYFACSNACILKRVFHYIAQLERLAICAIIDHPRLPIALSHAEIVQVLQDCEVGHCGEHLRQLRVMIEDKVNPGVCHTIAAQFPNLEILEIEICGYHDGKSVFAWSEFGDTFAPLSRLRQLRLCIQFPEYDEMAVDGPWRVKRRECALYFARRLPCLERVGFEYRQRTGTHKYVDSWLEFDIDRDDGDIELYELAPSWYPFPEVWSPVPVPV